MKYLSFLIAMILLVSDFQIDGTACMMTPKNFTGRISQNSHKAILVHRDGRQDMILKIGYQFAGQKVPEKFAWIVTVPNEPEKYNVATDDLFTDVSLWAHSLVIKKIKRDRKRNPDEEVDSAKAGSALVFSEPVKVGPYDIQPVQARGLAALTELNKWLTKNGFPTEDPDHMKYFVENRFTFLAIKISPQQDKKLAQSGTLPPLHLSFKSKSVYYPLMFSSRQGVFDLQLFTLTNAELDYRNSAEALRKISWRDSNFLRNVLVKSDRLPDTLKLALKRSAFDETPDQYYLNVLNCRRVNRGNSISTWKSDIFLSVDANVKADASLPYFYSFYLPAGIGTGLFLVVVSICFRSNCSHSSKLKSATLGTILLTLAMFSAAGCGGIETGFDDRVEVGAVKLRDLAHLESYLCNERRGGESWSRKARVKSETTAELIWNFQPNGTFHLWLDRYDSKESPPDDFFSQTTGLNPESESSALQGKYKVTLKELKLTNIRTSSGMKLKDHVVPIQWIDGKLRIGINGHHFMRVHPKAPAPPQSILDQFK